MRRAGRARGAALTAGLGALALALAVPALATAKLKADYRFEGNFHSKVGPRSRT